MIHLSSRFTTSQQTTSVVDRPLLGLEADTVISQSQSDLPCKIRALNSSCTELTYRYSCMSYVVNIEDVFSKVV